MKFGFTTFSTGKKITIYTLLVLLLLIVSVIITQKTLSKLSQTLDFITQPNLKQAKIRDILYDLSEAESAVRAYSITLENKYLDPYYHLLTTYDNDIRELKELSAGNNNHKLLIDTIGDLIGEKTLVLNGFIAIEKNQDVAEALKEIIRKIEAEEYKFQQKRIFKQEKEKVSSKEKSAETEEKINKDSLEQKVETSEQKQSIWKRIGNAFSKKEKNKDTESSQSLSGKEDEKNIQNKDSVFVISNKQPVSVTDAVKKDIEQIVINIEREKNKEKHQYKAALIEWDKSIKDRISALIIKIQEDDQRETELRGKEARQMANSTVSNILVLGGLCITILLFLSVFVANDIRKTNRHRELLERANHEIEKNAKTKEEFLTNISHEIRTPMNAISGFSEQLAKTKLTPVQAKYLNYIELSSSHLLNIINDLLDLSKIGAGKLSIDSVGFKPLAVFSETEEIMKPLVAKKKIKLSVETAKNINEVLVGDPLRLRQILINLVSNAIKFTEKGYVKVACNVVKEDEFSQQLKIEVADTGIGISEEKQKHIFSQFSQADSSITRKFGGTGLGLALCKRLVEMQGGEIFLKSKEGEGSIFTVILNYRRGTAEDLSEKNNTKAIDTAQLKNKKILVADDEQFNQVLIQSILQNSGAEITCVKNGQEAVEMIEREKYDLILMDVQMPVLSGIEATQIIRKKYPAAELPVIAITANAFLADTEKYFDAGMNDYLIKPFKERELIDKLLLITGNIKKATTKHSVEEIIETNQEYDLTELENAAEGNAEFKEKMIKLFISTSSESIEQIKTALEQNDYKSIAAAAHKLTPSCRHLGMDSLAQMLKNIEETALEYKPQQIKFLVEQMLEKYEKAVSQLKQLIA